MEPTKDTRQLNWLLAWAGVFCDIGTSVYYVPGILYGHVKDATPFFVLLTTGGFILLSLKYIEISWRNSAQRWPADMGWRWQVQRWTEWESRPAWVPRRPPLTPSRLTSDSAVMT